MGWSTNRKVSNTPCSGGLSKFRELQHRPPPFHDVNPKEHDRAPLGQLQKSKRSRAGLIGLPLVIGLEALTFTADARLHRLTLAVSVLGLLLYREFSSIRAMLEPVVRFSADSPLRAASHVERWRSGEGYVQRQGASSKTWFFDPPDDHPRV